MADRLPVEQQNARLLDYQRALAGFSRSVSEVMPLERLLHFVCAQVSRVTHIRHTKVMCYRADKGDLLMVAGVGWKEGVVGTATFALDSASPPGRTMQTGAPVLVEDLTNSNEYRLSPVLRDHGIVTLLNVPVRIDGRVWGVLEIDSQEPRSFDEAVVLFLTTVASILGVALLRIETERKAAEAIGEHAREKSFFETLLREFQHRVKNNLQLIVSFLSLQRHAVTSPDDRERFTRVMERVHAIALAQDQLSFEGGSSNVEFGDYLRALCANIDPQREKVSIEVEVETGARLSLDRAVAAGLVVNELVTNAFKHAFDETGGKIRVAFTSSPDRGEASLTVEDNGRGMGPARPGGLGLQLIKACASQLDGRVERETVAKGTRTRVRFPLPM
jgi:two-component sensor histidine kinase